jgi:hypothetical protein
MKHIHRGWKGQKFPDGSNNFPCNMVPPQILPEGSGTIPVKTGDTVVFVSSLDEDITCPVCLLRTPGSLRT